MIYWFLCLYRRPLFWFNLRHKSKILHFSLSTNGWSACRFFDLCRILSLYISIDSEWSTDSYVCIVGLYFDLIFDINLKYFISLFRPMDDQLAGFSISLLYSFVIYLNRFRMIYWFLCLYRRPLFWFNLRHKSKILHFSLSTNGWSACRFFDLSVVFFRYISQSIQNDLLILMFVS